MVGIALEPDFTTEAADIQKELETYTHKRKLIEPVKSAYKLVQRAPRRDSGQKLAQLQSVTDCHQLPIAAPVALMMSIEKRITEAIFAFFNYLGQYV